MISGIQFYENGVPNIKQNGGNYAKVSRFCYNYHLSGVKMLAKFIRRGIRV
jgi:hypothetical protein